VWAPGPVWTANSSTLKVTVIRISANENYAKYGSRNITIRQSIYNPDILTYSTKIQLECSQKVASRTS